MQVQAPSLDKSTQFAEDAEKAIHLKDLMPGSELVIGTEDAEYDVTILNPQAGTVRVKGGVFTEPTECHFGGSATGGGSFLWSGAISVYLCMEFYKHGRVITTMVKTIGRKIKTTVPVSTLVH